MMRSNTTCERSLKQLAAIGFVEIQYYTDPLCCWSWAFEDEWNQFKSALGNNLRYQYRMGGLIAGWSNYQDLANEVTRPAQMGPVWMHVAERVGKKVDASIWSKDPPASSYPACMAIKCAELQTTAATEIFMAQLRKAVFEEARNIAKYTVLKEIATTVQALTEGAFTLKQFDEDMNSGKGLDLVRADIEDTKRKGITRFPTLVIRQQGRPAKLVTGFKTCEELFRIVEANPDPVAESF